MPIQGEIYELGWWLSVIVNTFILYAMALGFGLVLGTGKVESIVYVLVGLTVLNMSNHTHATRKTP